MRLVIDGYNLIHHCPELALAEARGRGREALMQALRLYRKRRPHHITVVFDGGPEPGGQRTSLAGLPVVFSGAARSADDVIADLARQEGRNLTVITADHELADRCRLHSAVVLDSGEFSLRLMETALGEAPAEEAEAEGWDFSTRKKGPAKRLSKAQRRKGRRKGRL
ncbi:MAG: hypothetical protein C4525_06805 [Desulfarculus sp.]|nr:MAG: hypothetical protein C4525_06805 [Desulfarculus sp.]